MSEPAPATPDVTAAGLADQVASAVAAVEAAAAAAEESVRAAVAGMATPPNETTR